MKLKSLLFSLLLFPVTVTFGQYGPSAVMVNCNAIYMYFGTVVSPSWEISSNGYVVSTVQNGGSYQATVKWTSGTSGTITFKDGSTIRSSKTVSVNQTPLPPLAIGNSRCGPGTLVLQAAPGATGGYVRWYDAQSGASYFAQSVEFTTPVISTTQTYWVTTYDMCTGLESSPRTPVIATITGSSDLPASSFDARGFANSQVVLSVSELPGISTYRWYTSLTETTPIATTGTPSLTRTIMSPVTLYVCGVGSCEGPRKAVSATIEPDPVVTADANRVSVGSSATLETAEGYLTYTWRNQNDEVVGSGRTLSVSMAGAYTVEVTKSDVSGSGVSLPYIVLGQMDDQNLNYIITNNPLVPVQQENAVDQLTVAQNMQTIQYFDELGRPIQTVITQNSPTMKDIVLPMAYDEFGRVERKYLPYTGGTNGWYKTLALVGDIGNPDPDVKYEDSEQYQFYQVGGNVATDSKPFAATAFEENPLDRVFKQGSSGAAWQPDVDPANDKSIKLDYFLNTESEVLMFNYDATTGLVNAGTNGIVRYYPVNTLYVNVTTDENNNQVVEYIDKEGFTVCRKVQYGISNETGAALFASTYYIYDDHDNLIAVLPPEAINNSLDSFIK